MTVRVRIAPSPTGAMHIGTARTALFNWLYARRRGGTFIVRIDDTDRERSDPAFERDILDGLRWLGLSWDEGVEVGGPYGTYRQSDRFDRYRQEALRLVTDGSAYYCFCTPEELEARRIQAEVEGRPPGYDGRCRLIPPEEASARMRGGEQAAIRFAIPRPGETVFEDLVRGTVRFDHAQVDDNIILRSDGTPTYHLASTVDDVDYHITHVARGEDLLPSTPRHIRLAMALGGEVPVYAHLPLLMGTDGRRLSKRHGAKGITEYRESGYLPEAMVNYLSLLSWSLDGQTTIFSLEQAVEVFDLTDVSAHAAVFDADKLIWINGEYIRGLAVEEFSARVRPFVQRGLGRVLADEEWGRFLQIASLVQERVKVLTEAADQVRFLFVEQVVYDRDSWSKVMSDETATILEAGATSLQAVEEWEHGPIEETLRTMVEELGLSPRRGLQPIRVAVTGTSISPPLFESIAALGRERTLRRLGEARERLR